MAGSKPGSGSGGPWRGSYETILIGSHATMSMGVRTTEFGRFRVPAGAMYVVTGVQAYASNSGSRGGTGVARVSVFSGGAGTAVNATISGEISLASGSVSVGTLNSVIATAAGVRVGVGVPVLGTTDIICTASSEDTLDGAREIKVYLTGFWPELPTAFKSAFE